MTDGRSIVIKLSGSALETDDNLINIDYLRQFGDFIAHLSRTWRVALTVGGGKVARHHIHTAKQLGLSDTKASLLGGDVGLINCRLTIASLVGAGVSTPSEPIENWGSAEEHLRVGIVPVLFGRWPAMTSDSVAVYFADYISATLVLKLSRVDAIYDNNPNLYPDAVPKQHISHDELETVSMQGDSRVSGNNFVVDLLAAKRLKNSKIPMWLLHMSQLETAIDVITQGLWDNLQNGTLIGERPV